MELERTAPRTAAPGGSGPDLSDEGRDTLRAEELLAAADRILDSLKPINAQTYLEQNQQRGGE